MNRHAWLCPAAAVEGRAAPGPVRRPRHSGRLAARPAGTPKRGPGAWRHRLTGTLACRHGVRPIASCGWAIAPETRTAEGSADDTYRPARADDAEPKPEPASPDNFVETALKLGGKSEEEARNDRHARPGRRPGRGAVRPAVPDVAKPRPPRGLGPRGPGRAVPAASRRRPRRAATRRWSESLEVVRRHRDGRDAARRPTARSPTHVLDDLAEAGYWGLLIDPRVRRQRRPVRRVRAVPDPDGDARRRPSPGWPRSTAASAPSIRCGPSAPPSRKQRFLPRLASGERLSGVRPDRAGRRLRPDRPARPRPCSTATTTSSTARSCSSPTPSRAARSAWSCLIDRQAGRADRRPARPRERAVPARARTACTPCKHSHNNGLQVQRLPRAAREPADAAAGRRPDDRLSRPEPGPRRPVRDRRRHACG